MSAETDFDVVIMLKDRGGKPVAFEPYRVELPDGTVVTGRLDANGYARIPNEIDGNAQVMFPEQGNLSIDHASSSFRN